MFLKKIITVCVICLSGSFFLGMIFDYLYKHNWAAVFIDKTAVLVNGKINYDIILLGNSKMHFGINPYYFDSVTKYNSYNFGYGGADAEEILLTTYVYLDHRKGPKLAIISMEITHLIKHNNLQADYYNLFYLKNDSIRAKLNRVGYLTNLMQIFPFVKYSFFDEYNRSSIFINKNIPKFDHNIYKGFINIHQQLSAIENSTNNIQIDTLKVSLEAIDNIEKMVTRLQFAGSTVVFIIAPIKNNVAFATSSYKKIGDSIIKNLATKYGVKCISFENLFPNNSYFSDQFHLNEPCTRIYSRSLGDSINKYFPHP